MQVGAGYGEEEMCVCYVCFCANTWVSWQPSEERSRSSDIPAAGPTPCSRPPNQWEQRGEGVQLLQNSFRSRRSGRMCGAGGRGGSDATAHIACISSSQLKKQASELISVSTGNPERRQNSKWKDSPPSPFFLWV